MDDNNSSSEQAIIREFVLERDQPRPSKPLTNALVWMDLEMTGLDPESCHIMEIAVIITDGKLTGPNIEGPDLVIHQSDEVLETMNDWCKEHHGESGLTDRCRESTVSLAEAESKVLEFLEKYTESAERNGHPSKKAYLAGNSIHVDRSFIRKYMPRVFAHLHYRMVDVSTVAELARRWFPEEIKRAPRKLKQHTAMADIRESLNELKFYRRAIFKAR